MSEIAALCGRAGANHLRATLFVGGVLVVLAVLPLILERTRPGIHPVTWTTWAFVMVLATILGVASLGLAEYAPEGVFFDL
ncbi:MAG: hypothetical protein M3450_05170 [Actinomycetota bacterium]|nr:hypothetical protein [Actinomycetota bacterium]